MHGSKIAIWFFIGLLLTVYGVMIFGYGIYEAVTGNFPPGMQLTQLHRCGGAEFCCCLGWCM